MKFIADLHVHSKYSRATAKNLDLENMHISASKKGISVIGTGDFTHPAWFLEIKEKLIPSDSGLFQIKKSILKQTEKCVPDSCQKDINFILSCEISTIYKKNGKVRKNHNLVFFSDLDSVEKFNKKMEKIGNIRSDGRPILGLDARDLLESVLETSELAFMIPAHIWTPWFSLFGSKSGFDSLEDCFADLTPYIFALETGLSSDPEMNWRISQLDGMTLVSNSDAHSPGKIAREANLFDTELSFSGIRKALMNKNKGEFKGTYEFFPEEGKYHLDGHRKCGIRFEPEETRNHKGLCPKCNRDLTQGVLHRVFVLADREKEKKPEGAPSFHRMIPLDEILSEIFGVGTASKKINIVQNRLIEKLGPELTILHKLPTEMLDCTGVPLFGEAIRRARNQEILIQPGYDGQFGTLKIFNESERKKLFGQRALFAAHESDGIKQDIRRRNKTLKQPEAFNRKEQKERPALKKEKKSRKL